jgi:hypothetical protein
MCALKRRLFPRHEYQQLNRYFLKVWARSLITCSSVKKIKWGNRTFVRNVHGYLAPGSDTLMARLILSHIQTAINDHLNA